MRGDVEMLSGRTLVYVVSRVHISQDRAGPMGLPTSGYDIDGVFAGTAETSRLNGGAPAPPSSLEPICNRTDTRSAVDPTQNCPLVDLDPTTRRCRTTTGCLGASGCVGGVDNTAFTAFDAIAWNNGYRYTVEHFVGAYYASGASYVFRFVGVDSLDDDPSVVLKIYRAIPRFGRNCNDVVADRRYVLLDSSIRLGEVELPRFTPIVGRITRGRFVSSGEGTWEIPFTFASEPTATPMVPFERVRLSVDLAETRGLRGNVGGTMSREGFTNHVTATLGVSARMVPWWAVPDLTMSRATPGTFQCVDPERDSNPDSQHASFGFEFELVRALLDEGSVATPPLGACGSW